MKTSRYISLVAIAWFIVAIAIAPAWGEKGGNGHGRGHGNSSHDEDASGDVNVNVNVQIGASDRTMIQQYIANDYRAHCPPGLAKKQNGCLPPGQAKKRYVVGQALPPTVVWTPVPQSLLVQLGPVPVGYQYVRVDKDVLLISQASHKVIDAITLLSAVGR